MASKKLYLYLARRDKKGLKILNTFLHDEDCPPLRVTDVKTLSLPKNMEAEIASATHEHRMLWEVWIETAADYAALKASLQSRGYTQLPTSSLPMFSGRLVAGSQPPQAKTAKVGDRKTMLRRFK